VSAEEIAETKKYLESRVLHGKETAEQISKMEEGEEKDKAVREFGGKQTIEKTLADNTKYELPTAAQVDKEVIPPRPEAGQGAYGHLKPGQSTPKLKLAQEGWDKKYGNMKPAESTTQTPAPASLPNAGQKVSAVTTENQKLSIEEKLQQSVEKTVNNSSVSSMNTSPPSKNPIPSVRNKEETFDRVNFFLIRPI
jgi:hypothetical protein